MFETLAAALPAAGNLAGSVMGMLNGNEAAAAQRQANNIALYNWLENRRNGELQRELATAGRTTARGDTTRYIPGVGWVSELGATSRGLQDASDREQLQRMTIDAMRARARRTANSNRQNVEGQFADRMLAQLGNAPIDQRQIESLLMEAGAAEANSGAENARNAVGVNRMRTGTGGETAIAALNRNQMLDTRSAIANARLRSGTETASRERTRMGNILDPYGMLASRAAAPDDVPFQPAGIGTDLDNSMLQQAVNAPGGMRGLTQIDAPRMGFAENRTPVGLASLGAALGQLGNMSKSMQTLFGNSSNRTAPHEMEGVF